MALQKLKKQKKIEKIENPQKTFEKTKKYTKHILNVHIPSTKNLFLLNLIFSDYCFPGQKPIRCLVDTGADGCYISEKLTTQLKIPITKKNFSTPVVLADASSSHSIGYETIPLRITHEFEEKIVFDILPSLQFDVILGLSWLQRHRPVFDWTSMTLTFPDTNNEVDVISDSSSSKLLPDSEIHESEPSEPYLEPDNSVPPVLVDLATPVSLSTLDFVCIREPFQNFLMKIHNCNNDTSATNALFDELSFNLHVEKDLLFDNICSLQQPPILPVLYQDFANVFSEEMADILPENRRYDCPIDLIDNNAKPPFKAIYHLSPKEAECLRQYIDENLKKGFIRPSKSPFGSPIFFVPKKDNSLRPCVDYRDVNAITIRNRHPLPLINEMLDRFHQAKLFTKIDLRGA